VGLSDLVCQLSKNPHLSAPRKNMKNPKGAFFARDEVVWIQTFSSFKIEETI